MTYTITQERFEAMAKVWDMLKIPESAHMSLCSDSSAHKPWFPNPDEKPPIKPIKLGYNTEMELAKKAFYGKYYGKQKTRSDAAKKGWKTRKWKKHVKEIAAKKMAYQNKGNLTMEELAFFKAAVQ